VCGRRSGSDRASPGSRTPSGSGAGAVAVSAVSTDIDARSASVFLDGVSMITWTATPAQAPNLPALWECAEQSGWMTFAGARVVIQFRPAGASRVLLDTVVSLARFLAD